MRCLRRLVRRRRSRRLTHALTSCTGQGSFGIIRKVRRKADGQILCRKEISYSRMSDKEKQQLGSELEILKGLRHPNIVQYYNREHIRSSQDLHLYMEYCGNGDLGGYIKKLKDRNQLADEEFVWSIFAQLVGALYRCHYGEDPPRPGEEGAVRKGKEVQSKQGYRVILHRDLKPENGKICNLVLLCTAELTLPIVVFLSQNNAVKLGDFGLSKIIASHDFASTYVGTPFYMSPEICAAERYSHHSDVWSLGCIIYELATRCVPFEARTHVELVMKIKAGRIKALPSCYSHELWEVIAWCLKVDPRSRPDTAQLLNVTQIKLARAKSQQAVALEHMQSERDVALHKLSVAQKQIQELQVEVAKLRDAGKKAEMEWHARATLAIDQRVAEQKAGLEKDKLNFQQELQKQFEAAVDQQVEDKLRLHEASLPSSHGLGQNGASKHVRSSTPPPGKANTTASFSTTAMTAAESDGSSVAQDVDDSLLETDISSLSIMEREGAEDGSPLAQRVKPVKKSGGRKPFGRAKTLANCSFDAGNTASPMDVHMADPSPMPNHIAPMSIKGLSLSPRRNGEERLSGAGLRRNIFTMAAQQKLRPAVGDELTKSFADDDAEDDEILDPGLDNSPSRPTSGLSNHAHPLAYVGDPFKAAGSDAPPKRAARPSLARQQTMPVHMHPRPRSQQADIFNPRSKIPEKENRPPSSNGRSGVPVLTTSPKRAPVAGRDGKVLTPSRKAPPPPPSSGLLSKAGNNTAPNLAKLAHVNNFQSPGKVRGRTLVELQQARQIPTGASEAEIVTSAPRLLPSPAKWDPMEVEEMPSPFLSKKGRAMR